MNLHLTSIIPLVVGLVLLAIGLIFSHMPIIWISTIVLTYGIVVHTNNVAVVRRAARTNHSTRMWNQINGVYDR